MVGVLQYLAVTVIMLWMFWRIFNKAGRNPWWAYLMLLPILGLFIPPVSVGLGLLIGVPVLMIWAFAFVPWPAIDTRSTSCRRAGLRSAHAREVQGPVQAIHAAERDGQPQGPRDHPPAEGRRDDE